MYPFLPADFNLIFVKTGKTNDHLESLWEYLSMRFSEVFYHVFGGNRDQLTSLTVKRTNLPFSPQHHFRKIWPFHKHIPFIAAKVRASMWLQSIEITYPQSRRTPRNSALAQLRCRICLRIQNTVLKRSPHWLSKTGLDPNRNPVIIKKHWATYNSEIFKCAIAAFAYAYSKLFAYSVHTSTLFCITD